MYQVKEPGLHCLWTFGFNTHFLIFPSHLFGSDGRSEEQPSGLQRQQRDTLHTIVTVVKTK